MAAQLDDIRVPITLLTGFLGAGKTTLLNHLIQDPQAGRVAVIMNEFGDVRLDHDLIETTTAETILMPSGCLCCTIRGDLADCLISLLDRREQGELAFDRVVIETTGIADPGPILHALVLNQALAGTVRMDGVVTLADAATGLGVLDRQFEARHQIAMADLIVLSKTDLVTADQLARFEQRLRQINPTAQRLLADHGRVPMGRLFGLSALRRTATPQTLTDWLGSTPEPADPLAGVSGLSGVPGLSGLKTNKTASAPLPGAGANRPAQHGHQIVSASIEVTDPIPPRVFDTWLDRLIAMKGPDVLRVKGLVHVQDLQWPFVFHGVQHVFDAPVPLTSWTGDDTISRVVVIARDMTEAELMASLETLRLTSEETKKKEHARMVKTAEIPF